MSLSQKRLLDTELEKACSLQILLPKPVTPTILTLNHKQGAVSELQCHTTFGGKAWLIFDYSTMSATFLDVLSGSFY